MRTVRLLPVVVVAASALLVLKTVGLVTDGAYTLVPQVMAAGDPQAEAAPPALETCPDGTTAPPGDCLAEGAISSTETEPPPQMTSESADRLAESLAERRRSLDTYAEELDLREALIRAAELRVEERAAAMAALESQLESQLAERDAADAEQLAQVVSMYETMRPRDAATIFDALDMDVLIEIAGAIQPRRMAPILAAMDTARAQDLTVRLAARVPVQADLPAAGIDELPQIVGQ